MKRAAAIIGPTPPFVRWAIKHPCSFRDLETDDLTYQTFRQLRALREVSTCYADNRVVNGFCLHGKFHQNLETARGFPVEEVLQFFGTRESVSGQCNACQANVSLHQTPGQDRRPAWAGCYGWFRATEGELDLIADFETAADRVELDWSEFGNATQAWHRVWQTKQWQGEQLDQLNRLVRAVPEQAADNIDFANFQLAVEACTKQSLPLFTELVPAGHSDGNQWKVFAHCQICRMELEGGHECKCPECGRIGFPIEEKSRKVLGLRPYMLLTHIIGADKTADLLDAYADARQTSDG